MKKICTYLLMGCLLLSPLTVEAEQTDTSYTMIIEGQDWGPSITKLVIKDSTSLDIQNYKVKITQTLAEEEVVNEEVEVMNAYYANEKGEQTSQASDYIALTLKIGPDYQATNPFYFDPVAFANTKVEMDVTIEDLSTNKVWNTMDKQYKLVADEFEKDVFDYVDSEYGNMQLSYGSYAPESDDKKNALIIWLHGMGEGGNDPELVLLGNEVTNLAKQPIQEYFEGAYVLAPQTPTFWLDQGDGNMTIDGTSKYSGSLFALIDTYVKKNPDIDTDKIMIGGCSNGGFMTMRMIIDHPEYFAAAFPICEALYNDYVSDDDIQKIKHMPIWFTHALGDELAEPDYISIPTYERLMAANAQNVHFTLFNNVQDNSGNYMQEDNETPFEYSPHFVWIHTLNDKASIDYDGMPVYADGKPVTIFKWLSLQTKQPSQYVAPTFMDNYGMVIFSIGGVSLIALAVIYAGKKKEIHHDTLS